jgi:hypothetical protein
VPPKKRIAQDKSSWQEKKAAQLTLLKQQLSIQHPLHILNVLNDWPQLWPKPEFKPISDGRVESTLENQYCA